jgi:hypothetical protein
MRTFHLTSSVYRRHSRELARSKVPHRVCRQTPRGRSRVREFRSHGSGRGALSNERPYREHIVLFQGPPPSDFRSCLVTVRAHLLYPLFRPSRVGNRYACIKGGDCLLQMRRAAPPLSKRPERVAEEFWVVAHCNGPRSGVISFSAARQASTASCGLAVSASFARFLVPRL